MESNEKIRLFTYERMPRSLFVIIILLMVAPIIGFLLYQSDWSMFLSCLIVFIFQLILAAAWQIQSEQTISIKADEIEVYTKKEKITIYLYIFLLVIVTVLYLYPFFLMSKSFVRMLFRNGIYVGLYEGGLLVFMITSFMLLINLRFFTLVPKTTDFFKLKKQFLETGFTPEEKAENERKILLKESEDKIKKETEKYGEGYTFIYSGFYINESLQKIFIEDKEYAFSDLIDFSIHDDPKTIHSGLTSTSKTDNLSMLGRAAVGGLVAGDVGAVIGGATASKTVETSDGVSYIEHNYSIIVTFNSLSSPEVTLYLGDSEKYLNRISSILTVIINRNKSK